MLICLTGVDPVAVGDVGIFQRTQWIIVYSRLIVWADQFTRGRTVVNLTGLAY